MRFHLITSFLIISYILLSSSTCALEPNKLVTKETLSTICSKSLNSVLCFDVLKDLIGKPLAKTTFSTIAIRPMNLAQSQAKENHKMIKTMYYGLIDPSREVRDRYRRCMVGYDDAFKYLQNGYMIMKRVDKNGTNKNRVKRFALSAMARIDSCDKSFNKPPPEPLTLKNANTKFKDLCSIIAAI